MNGSILTTRIPVDQKQRDGLRTMFASGDYLTLREVISAHCVEAQIDSGNKALYANENAKLQSEASKTRAAQFNTVLDVLDFLERNGEEWFRISLEQRR